jgi:hypothetical protein
MAAALAAGSSGGVDLQPGARALFVGRAYYGCAATVLDPGSDGFTRKVGTPQECSGQQVLQAAEFTDHFATHPPMCLHIAPVHAVQQRIPVASTGGCQDRVGTCLGAGWMTSC